MKGRYPKLKTGEDCCGCTACASICTHDAIVMKPDTMGFVYPQLDKSKCIGCGLCEKVCAFNDNYDKSSNLTTPIAYGARHKDIKEVETSRSGAAFIAISDYVLEKGGVVYGAGYKDHFRVCHKRATTKIERDEFKGSKYVQSDLTGIFRRVKNDLKEGRLVLFSGTPCQTSGLNSYIGKKLRENLILVDIICHGVPGANIWKDFLTYLEQEHDAEIISVDFRDKKKFGWNAHIESFIFKTREGDKQLIYTDLFYKHIMFRKSCGKCHFCNTTRPSDITIGDFWGWDKTDAEINKDERGVSLILINTQKGGEIFDKVKDRMFIVPAKLEDCLQPNLIRPSIIHPKRNKFERDYKKYGFCFVINHDYDNNLLKKIVYKLKSTTYMLLSCMNFVKK